jgi:endoglucanase
MPRYSSLLLAIAALTLPFSQLHAADIVSVQPLTESILMVHFDEGHIEYHQRGEPRTADKVVISPLDIKLATNPAHYSLSSSDDPAYKTKKSPKATGRKSKGTEFAWFVDSWENGKAVNKRPDHVKEHWIYLELPSPLKPGKSYELNAAKASPKSSPVKLKFDLAKSRSEAVHVNTLGYVPNAPQKFGYVYHWLGDRGPLDLKPFDGTPFHLIDSKTGDRAFSGKMKFRKAKENPETVQAMDSPPHGNYLLADVYECDFSAFNTPGNYVLAVERIGCSWPFQIESDVYRPAFNAVTRALYHNRSGIELKQPFTKFTRPAPHHPQLTPGFQDKLRYTKVRSTEWGSEGGDAKVLMASSPGPLTDSWGWYQDAGDWDSYESHLRVAKELLLAYEMAPQNFTDGELNLPESGNGLPDILDEAAWLPRFCHRLRAELVAKGYGTGGIGLRVSGDAFGTDEGTKPDGSKFGRGSWEDTDRVWMVSGEDPWSTFTYAGVAANLAYCLKIANVSTDPEQVDWQKEATESFTWAQQNIRPGDDQLEGGRLAHTRAYAAASLYRLTGDAKYQDQYAQDTKSLADDTILGDDNCYGPFVVALDSKDHPFAAEVHAKSVKMVFRTADENLLSSANRRALRWGGSFYMPMLVGQQTTPWIVGGMVATTIAPTHAPDKATAYRGALYTTCDYFLGCNALNQTWITGIGPRHPTAIFHMDAWYNGHGTYHPGLIPYSPWRKEKDEGQGPWDQAWAHSTLHPKIDSWPGNERWFNNRCSPMASEFTVHQNLGPAAAAYGFLCSPK